MIFAIDPGPKASAYVRWNGVRVIESGWKENAIVRELVATHSANHDVAIENIACYGMAVGAEVFATCVEIGRFVEIATRGGVDPMLVFRKDIKLHLCGSLKAKDPNIRQALIDRFGAVGTKKNPGPLWGVKSHIWAALAVAVMVGDTEHGAEQECDPVRDGWVGSNGLP